MKRKKILSTVCLLTSLFVLNSCTEMKYDDVENGIRYTKDKSEDYFVMSEYIDDLPENLTIQGTIENYPVNGYAVNFKYNEKSTSGVKHLSFEPSKRFHAKFIFANLLDMTFPDNGSFMIESECENLKTVNLYGANLNCSLSSSRSIQLNMEGGHLYSSNPLGIMKIKKNSTIESQLVEDKDNFESNHLENKIAVFEDGYDFTDEYYCRNTYHYQKRQFFTGNIQEEKKYYLPFADVIYLPKSVTNICDRFFGVDTYGKTIEVHYEGSEEDWKKVKISSDNNDNYASVKMIYNSVYSE